MAEFNKINLNSVSNVSNNNGVSESQRAKQGEGKDFANVLKESIDTVDAYQKKGDKALADMASGQIKDLHQAGIAIGKAENSMKMMLEVRNKAISAYKEILRTQV